MGRNTGSGGEGSKNGSHRDDLNRSAYSQRNHFLPLSVCRVGTWQKSRLLTLKTNLATYCRKSPTQLLFFSYVVWGLGRGEFSFSESLAFLNWGPFWKVGDSWCHTNYHYTCSLHSLNKLFQFINILLHPEFLRYLEQKQSQWN